MSTERLDILIRQARAQTGNQEYGANQGVPQREFVRHANDAQERIYNKLLQKRSTLYVKETFEDSQNGVASYTLPTDVHLTHNLVGIDYSPTGQASMYRPLDMRTLRQRISTTGYPESYVLRDGSFIVSPIPSSDVSNAFRLNYQYTLPTLDVRRAKISRVDGSLAPEVWSYASLSAGSTRAGAYGAGLFVLAGSNGVLYTSTDGENWTSRTSAFGSTTISKLIFANGRFIAVSGSGVAGKVAYSTDGISWTLGSLSGISTTAIADITYGDGRFVIVYTDSGSGEGYSAWSETGATWTSQVLESGSTRSPVSIAFSSELRRFVVAAGSAGTGKVYYSNDGRQWHTNASGFSTNAPSRLVCGDAGFVCGQASGVISTSEDGIVWVQPTTGLSALGTATVAYGEGVYVACSATGGFYSTNLTDWTAISFGGTAPSVINFVRYADGAFIVQDSATTLCYSSTDGASYSVGSYQPGALAVVLSNGSGTWVGGFSLLAQAAYSTPDFKYSLNLDDYIIDESEQDLQGNWVDYLTIVDKDGEILVNGIEFESYDSTTRALVCSSSESLADLEDSYICFGANATTHSRLPKIAERYLTHYMALMIQLRDSSSEAVATDPVLKAIEDDILDGVENLEEDLVAIPLLDLSMLDYSADYE